MIKSLIVALSILSATSIHEGVQGESTVFVCNSETATKYHLKKDCRGLNACKHTVVEVTLSDAKSRKLTLCGWED